MIWLILYNILFPFLALGFFVLGLVSRRRKTFLSDIVDLRSVGERLGIGSANAQALLWFHGASLGEIKALSGILETLKKEGVGFIHLTTMTRAGKIWAQENFLKNGLAASVSLIPLDFCPCVIFYLRRMKQLQALIIVETELWPNLIFEAKRRGLKLALINARLSPKSLNWLKLLPSFAKKIIGSFDAIGANGEDSLKNFLALAPAPSRLVLTGNLKWDFRPPEDFMEVKKRALLKAQFGFKESELLFVAGSTHAPEESDLVKVFNSLRGNHPNLRLVLAPRHLERIAELRRLTEGVAGATLIEKFGVLTSLYAIADIIFVGGTLINGVGGHDILEAAAFAKPILIGPNFENFEEIVEEFKRQQAIEIVNNASDLLGKLTFLLDNRGARETLASAALRVFSQRPNASRKTLALLRHLDFSFLDMAN